MVRDDEEPGRQLSAARFRLRRARAGPNRRLSGLVLAVCVTAVVLVSVSVVDAAGSVRPRQHRVPKSERTGVVSDPAVISLSWSAVRGAGAYEIFSVGARSDVLGSEQAVYRHVPSLLDASAYIVTGSETTGYQPLGYSATFGTATGQDASDLLSPMVSRAFPHTAPTSTTRVGSTVHQAYVRHTATTGTRYAVAAVVNGHRELVAHVTATVLTTPAATASGATITVDPSDTYQTMSGFGATMNDVDAYELTQAVPGPVTTEAGVDQLAASPGVVDLFSPTEGIGLDYIRIPIGGNDFGQADYSKSWSLSNEYTEDDPEPGSTATSFTNSQLQTFISHDLEYLVPVLQAARQLDPTLQVTASPWTAPPWMKCSNLDAENPGATCDSFSSGGLGSLVGNGNSGYAGGMLNPADEQKYADYLLEFILAYKLEGLPLSSISVQNEPGNDDSSYPTMELTPQVEASVAEDLDADEHAAGVDVPILALDHNWNSTWPVSGVSDDDCSAATCYLNQVLADAPSSTFGGAAFHCYSGNPTSQDSVTLPIYDTECTPTGAYTATVDPSYPDDYTTVPKSFAGDLQYNTGQLVMGATENGDADGKAGAGASVVMLWNLVSNQNYGPTINPGCMANSGTPCLPVEELTAGGSPVPQVGFYVLGQFSRYVEPGAVRIASSDVDNLETDAFRDPDGEIVLVVLDNDAISCTSTSCQEPSSSQPFTVSWDGEQFHSEIAPGAVQTYVWNR